MTILYIYRNPAFGFSIGKVFKPIEEEMKKYADVDSIVLPKANYSLISLWTNIRYAQKAVKKKHYDIVHITGSEHYLIPFLWGQKIVVTVHDLGFYTNHLDKKIRALWKKLLWIRTLRKANIITCISEKTKSEVACVAKINAENLYVVNDPIGAEYIYYPHEFNFDYPTILQIGTKSNKNIERLFEALQGIKCKLVIIGQLSENHVSLLRKYKIDYINKCRLSDDEILQEYINCDIVSLPSLYEGFGMPIIEGQAVGRIIITSDVEPMNKISNGGAILVNPYDSQSIVNAVLNAKSNINLISIGLDNVHKYTPQIVAKQYFSIYSK